MNATKLLSIAALSTLAAFGAHADDGDTRSVAEVRAEARNPIVVTEGSTGPVAVQATGVTRESVRAQAIAALREGDIPSGEMGTM
jgi:hypothetical protein